LVARSAEKSRRALAGAGWAIVALGCALRILQYAANRSLSIDESSLALNVIEKSPQRLLHALDFNQAAPLGFLEMQKLAVTLFGRSEYALRLLPLLSSLVSLVVFSVAARKLLHPFAAMLAVVVFALLDPLVYYSATGKQYALDVATAVLVLAVALRFESRPPGRVGLIALAPFGAIVVWLSHPAAFVLAALGTVLALREWGSRRWLHSTALLAVFAAWGGSFTVQYVLSRSNLSRIVGAFEQGGGGAFKPTGGGPAWFDATIDRLQYVVGLEETTSGRPVFGSGVGISRALTILLLIVAAVGLASLVRSRPRMALMLVFPPVLAGVASTLHEYPLVGRTLLFALPSAALCLGEGLRVVATVRSPRWLSAAAGAVAVTCVGAITILPASHVLHPRANEEMKQALRYLGLRQRSGDGLYVSPNAQYAVAYYHLCGCAAFDPATVWPFATTSGTGLRALSSRSPRLVISSGSVNADVRPLRGRRRVWILVSELPAGETGALLADLGKLGTLLHSFRASAPSAIAAALYLYDFGSRDGG
jgi:hypothetical protein